MPIVPLRIGCGPAATHKPVCKRRLLYYELTAARPPRTNPFANADCSIANWVRPRRHAQTRLQASIVILRIDCGTAAPTGWAAKRQPPDAWASGENGKKEAVREKILSSALFFVFIAPVGTHPFVPQAPRGHCFFVCSSTSRVGCRDDVPARGRGAPCPVVPQAASGHCFFFTNNSILKTFVFSRIFRKICIILYKMCILW